MGLLHLLLHSGICHALLGSVLLDFPAHLVSWSVDDLFRPKTAGLALEEKLIELPQLVPDFEVY